MMEQHLPVLQILIPLLAAPLCLLITHRRLTWLFATVASWATFLNSILLFQAVQAQGSIAYYIGGWKPPEGIEYRIDFLNALVLLLISGVGAVVITYARQSVEKEIKADRHTLFYTAWMLCLTGLLGITATGDAFNVFVFLEISSLSTYALIALGNDRRALTASYRYLVMGTVGATFILIGIGLMYMTTGTLNMGDLAVHLPTTIPPPLENNTTQAAFAFLIVGISLKLALFPMHRWLPNAYTFAPSAVTAFLAATATKVSLYLLLRFFFTIFGEEFSFGVMKLHQIIFVLSILAIVTASAVAVTKTNLKRMLAYSSIAQIGYMTLGVSFGSIAGITAGILHMFNHALMKGCLFMALGCVVYRIGSVELEKFSGLAKRMPVTMACFLIGGLSIIGVPMTSGFISKWMLIRSALEAGKWPVAFIVLAASLLAVIYIWKVVEKAYLGALPAEHAEVREAPLGMLIPLVVAAFANLYFGVATSLPLDTARKAAELLIGGGP